MLKGKFLISGCVFSRQTIHQYPGFRPAFAGCLRLLDSLPELALNFGPLIYQLFVRLGSAFASVVLKDPIIVKPRLETMPIVCYLC
jgi:hypothetical protein